MGNVIHAQVTHILNGYLMESYIHTRYIKPLYFRDPDAFASSYASGSLVLHRHRSLKLTACTQTENQAPSYESLPQSISLESETASNNEVNLECCICPTHSLLHLDSWNGRQVYWLIKISGQH